MVIFIDDTNRITEINLKDTNTGVHWEADFYDTGLLTNANIDINDDENEEHYKYSDILKRNGYNEDDPVYMVEDIDYCIDQANDMINGTGDYDFPTPDSQLITYDLH